METIIESIENARKNLLDLSLRNRLINYRPSKARTIQIVNGDPRGIYDILVLKGKSMKFREKQNPVKESIKNIQIVDLEDPDNNGTQTVDSNEESTSVVWTTMSRGSEPADSKIDLTLQTSLDKENLPLRLYKVYQESTTAIEEQGYTILYLALGYLEWYEREDTVKKIKSPLILVPVDIKRELDRTIFTIKWTEEEVSTNLSLQEKLKEQGVILPDFDAPEDKSVIDEYFEAVNKAIKKFSAWRVLNDNYLDIFSFTKFIMYKDLDPAAWPDGMSPATHPLLNAIFNPESEAHSNTGFSEEDVDELLPVETVYHIMNADSSQIAVIEDIKASKNLVVEGPPGTGKSQTIVNAIAELLAQGKSVLFVSEKMAALEVVKKRLDETGIGNFCLQLHSRKANKKEVIAELKRTWDLDEPPQRFMDNEITQLEIARKGLNDYAKDIRTPFGKRQLSPYTLFGLNENVRTHFTSVGRSMQRVELSSVEEYSEAEWAGAIAILTKFREILPRVRPINANPWYCTQPGLVLPEDEEQIKYEIKNCQIALRKLSGKINTLMEIAGISVPKTRRDLEYAITATNLFSAPNPIERDLLLNPAWNEPNPNTQILTSLIKSYNRSRGELIAIFKENILDEDVPTIISDFEPLTQRFVLINILESLYNSRYRTIKTQVSAYYKSKEKASDDKILRDLKVVMDCKKNQNAIRSHGDLGRSLFGSLWLDEESNPAKLEQFSEWIVTFRHQLISDVFTERTVEMVSRGVPHEKIHSAASEAHATHIQFIEFMEKLLKRLDVDSHKQFDKNADCITFSEYDQILLEWDASTQSLVNWSHYCNIVKNGEKSIALPIIRAAETLDISPEDIIPTFEGNYYNSLIKVAFNHSPALKQFIGDYHETRIQQFMELDEKVILGNCGRLMWKLWNNMPRKYDSASRGSDMGTLRGEFSKQRKIMPIRKLMTQAGVLIQKIKPCFMMGPLSVAQFLDPKTIKFDVIIFDEASQVRPQDALGALLRSNQAVVIGDSHQLPPTSFFDNMVESDPDADDSDNSTDTLPSDFQSILDLCHKFPKRDLRWHYRSRHESLIALSNAKFYDNRLFVYPSPAKNTNELGLKFVHLPNCPYDGGSVNRGEAKVVAKAVIDQLRKSTEKSIGVGAFNIKQQKAIDDEIEFLLRDNPDLQQYFLKDRFEYCFIKNLETIQGDERDIIFISIGFGKNQEGILRQRFGPINQDGGERRLNVLMTRAREQCVVFCNFKSRDLPIKEASPVGMKILKLFLEYAETGELPTSMTSRGDLESPFEESIYDYLVSHGHNIEKQVGCAGFRIDLAVVDPAEPGRFMLGIECDGAQYHSSKVARDRDRLRQQILEGLGWQIHRVWSTDWFREPESAKSKLLQAIEASKLVSKTPQKKINPDKKHVIQKPSEIQTNTTIINKNEVIDTVNSTLPVYTTCTNIKLNYLADFNEVPTYQLVDAIIDIVEIESPIHIEEVMNRIQDLANIKRVGSKIQWKIENACKSAVSTKRIRRIKDHLWRDRTNSSLLRRRLPENSKDIEHICDEEIMAAIWYILETQFATTQDDIVTQISKIFNIKATTKVFEKIDPIIQNLIQMDRLEVLPNQKIYLKK